VVETQDCRSEEGKIVNAIDGMIAFAWLVYDRDLSTPNVQDALADLFMSPEFKTLKAAADIAIARIEQDNEKSEM
jgi:hypothetical protein